MVGLETMEFVSPSRLPNTIRTSWLTWLGLDLCMLRPDWATKTIT